MNRTAVNTTETIGFVNKYNAMFHCKYVFDYKYLSFRNVKIWAYPGDNQHVEIYKQIEHFSDSNHSDK